MFDLLDTEHSGGFLLYLLALGGYSTNGEGVAATVSAFGDPSVRSVNPINSTGSSGATHEGDIQGKGPCPRNMVARHCWRCSIVRSASRRRNVLKCVNEVLFSNEGGLLNLSQSVQLDDAHHAMHDLRMECCAGAQV